MTDNTRPQMPAATVETLARSVFEQAALYGFTRIDQVRLASALLSLCNASGSAAAAPDEPPQAVPAGTARATAPCAARCCARPTSPCPNRRHLADASGRAPPAPRCRHRSSAFPR